MKTRSTKVLLSLLAIMVAWFAVTNAYTFEVDHRSPFGVLNLSKLVIKPTTSTTGMTLSEYLLQINWTQGQINVHQICDENGEHCINIQNIWSWWGGTVLPDDFISWTDDKLCRKSGNKLVCNRGFWDGHIKFYNWTNNEAIVQKNGENLENDVPLDGEWIYSVYLPVPVISWTDQYICVKSGEDTICGTAKLWSMNPGKYCYFTGDSITCTEDGPWNGTITLQTLSWDNTTVTRSRNFNVNTPSDMTITIPWGGGWLPWPKWDTWAYIVSAAIDGQNIIFTLNNGDNITVPDIFSSIVWPQWETWATGLWIDHINTGKVNGVTTVTIIGTDNSTLASFQILDWQDWNWWNGINASWTQDQRCTWQCNGGEWTKVKRKCEDFEGSDKEECERDKSSYEEICPNENPNQECLNIINNIENPNFVELIEGQNCGVVCNQQEPSCQGQCEWWNWIQVTNVRENKTCRYVVGGMLDQLRLYLWMEDTPTISASWEVRCVFPNNESTTATGVTVAVTGTASTYCSSEDWITLDCSNNIPTWWPNTTTDGIWSLHTGDNIFDNGATIYPIQASYNVNIWRTADLTWYKLNVNGVVNFEANQASYAKFSNSRISFFGAKNFKLKNLNFQRSANNSVITGVYKTIPWLSVNWAVAAWNQNDYIYMYAGTWSSWTWVGRHYEIMWSNELSVGTKDWAFIYFVEKDIEYAKYIKSYTPALEAVPTSSTVSNSNMHAIAAPQPNELLWFGEIYNSLMVWVNTDDPRATLDVNWSIRVWNNCLPQNMVCSQDYAWMLTYFETSTWIWKLVVCTYLGNNLWYFRKDLIGWGTWLTLHDIWYNAICNISLASEALPGTLIPDIQ